MSDSNTDVIAQALNLTPLIPDKKEIKAIIKNDEYETAKDNMNNVIHVGTEALSELATMAQLSQDPRVYRVMTELLSAMVTANKELVEIKRINSDIEYKQSKKDEPAVVNQNLYVSTADLGKMLESIKNGKDT